MDPSLLTASRSQYKQLSSHWSRCCSTARTWRIKIQQIPSIQSHISQTILFNYTKRSASAAKCRHSLENEPPLTMYIGLNVHTQTRSRKLVTHLNNLGISISYDRIIQMENQLEAAVCEHIAKEGVVCLTQLRKPPFEQSSNGIYVGDAAAYIRNVRYTDLFMWLARPTTTLGLFFVRALLEKVYIYMLLRFTHFFHNITFEQPVCAKHFTQ